MVSRTLLVKRDDSLNCNPLLSRCCLCKRDCCQLSETIIDDNKQVARVVSNEIHLKTLRNDYITQTNKVKEAALI